MTDSRVREQVQPTAPNHMADPEWVTSQEAADHLGYTVQHVRRLVREGVLEGQKLGRDWLVRRESVLRYLAERENLRLPLLKRPRRA